MKIQNVEKTASCKMLLGRLNGAERASGRGEGAQSISIRDGQPDLKPGPQHTKLIVGSTDENSGQCSRKWGTRAIHFQQWAQQWAKG